MTGLQGWLAHEDLTFNDAGGAPAGRPVACCVRTPDFRYAVVGVELAADADWRPRSGHRIGSRAGPLGEVKQSAAANPAPTDKFSIDTCRPQQQGVRRDFGLSSHWLDLTAVARQWLLPSTANESLRLTCTVVTGNSGSSCGAWASVASQIA